MIFLPLFDFFDIFQLTYNIFINFLVEIILHPNTLILIMFTIILIPVLAMRGPSLETVRNVAMILGGLGTAAIASGVGGTRRNRAEEEAARKAEEDARIAKEEAKKAELNARLARDEAAQTKANVEAMQKRLVNLETRLEAGKK